MYQMYRGTGRDVWVGGCCLHVIAFKTSSMSFILISLSSLFLCVLDSGDGGGSRAGGGEDNGMSPAIYAGVAAAGVLLIIGIIVIIVLWKRKKTSSHGNDQIFFTIRLYLM